MAHAPGPSNPAMRHEVVTSLQILTLTAELLAVELRDGVRTSEQLQERGQALWDANQRVVTAAQRVPARQDEVGGDGGSFLAESESVREIRAFVGFITQHATPTDVEWDVLAEYVDGLHERAKALIQRID